MVSALDSSSVAANEDAEVVCNKWIVNPLIDLLFVCGGLLLLLVAVHCLVSGSVTRFSTASGGYGKILFLVTIIGQHVFTNGHTMATLERVYRTPETRRRFRFYTVWLPFLSLPLIAAAIASPLALSIIVAIYLVWTYQHYLSQSFGIALIYCYKQNYRLSGFEKQSLHGFLLSMGLFVVTTQLSNLSYLKEAFKQLTYKQEAFLPPWAPDLVLVAVGAFACAFAWHIIVRVVRDRQLMPVPALLIVATMIALACAVDRSHSLYWLYAPAFLHGSQYIAVVLSMQYKSGRQEINQDLAIKKCLAYFGILVASGIFLYYGIPQVLEQVGINAVLAGTAIFLVVNMHHYATDAAIWKMREPDLRKQLVC